MIELDETRQKAWLSLLLVVSLLVWATGACQPVIPGTEPQKETLADSAIERTTDTSLERPGSQEPPETSESTAPEPQREPTNKEPGTGEYSPEHPVPDETPAPDAQSLELASEPTDVTPERHQDTTDAQADDAPPEGRPEPQPDAPPQCAPHQPPSNPPKEWVYTTGEGASFISVKEIKADAKGFLYICGTMSGGPATFHKQQLTAPSGGEEMFVMKLNAAGNPLWVMSLPGQGSQNCAGLALGAGGSLYVTGGFSGDIPLTNKTLTAQGEDVFIAKLDACGDIEWLLQAGGKSSDRGHALALDSKGQLYIYGFFYGPASFGSHKVTTQDVGSVFVAKVTPQGSFIWVATGGSQSPEILAGMDVTAQGEVYIAGASYLPVTFGPHKLTSKDPFELFVAKVSTSGKWLWATQTTGNGRIIPYRAKLGPKGLFYVTGELDGTKTFDQMTLTSPAHGDIFVAQVSNAGKFQWVLRPKGTSHLHPYGLAFGASEIFVAGDYTGEPTFGNTKLPSSVALRSFVTQATTTSTPAFTWSTSTKGTDPVRAQALTIGPKGSIFVAGNFQSGGIFGNTKVKKKPFAYYMFIWKLQ